MNRIINGRTYLINLSLIWGSDSTDVEKSDVNEKNVSFLIDDNIEQLDIISTLSVPFVYGSFVYSDSKTNSKLFNMMDSPMVHGSLSFILMNGTDMPGVENNPKAFNEEYFTEKIFITSVETVDDYSDNLIHVKMGFASEDILKFVSNLKTVTTFDKSNEDKETDKVNDIIKSLFGAADLSEKLDNDSFTVNSDKKIKFISNPNDDLLHALEYVYRKTFDDNYTKTKDCSYVRIIYNHTKHKYVQWKYDVVGKTSNMSNTSNATESMIRDKVVVDLGKPGEPNLGGGKFYFSNSKRGMDSFDFVEWSDFVDYDYKKNEFTRTKINDEISDIIVKDDDEFSDKLKKKSKTTKYNGKKFKDSNYTREFTTSSQNGSIYDIISDSLFERNYYRVESNGSIGRKAGDTIFVEFSNAVTSLYENMDGDYLITAIDNRFVASDGNGVPSFRSIMDVHRPYCPSDEIKRKSSI